MCPGFEEWWCKTCDFNFYAQTMARRFLVDTTYIRMYVLYKAAGN